MNIYKRLLGILPQERVDVGKIIAVQSETVTVQLQNGNKMRVIGNGNINTMVYVKGGAVLGTAPNLTGQDVEV